MSASEEAAALHNQALAWEADGRWSEVETAYLEALALDPNRPSTCFNLGLLYKCQGRWAESLQSTGGRRN